MYLIILINLLVIGLSCQIKISPVDLDDHIGDFTKKCQDAMLKRSADVETCATKVADNLFINTLFDGGDMGMILKGACCAIDDLKLCMEVVKDECSKPEIIKIENVMEIMIKKEIIKLGISINCKQMKRDNCKKSTGITGDCQVVLRNQYHQIQKCQNDVLGQLEEVEHSKVMITENDNIKTEICCKIKQMKGCVKVIKGDCTKDDMKTIESGIGQIFEMAVQSEKGVSLQCSKLDLDICSGSNHYSSSFFLIMVIFSTFFITNLIVD